ncbi:MAG TPA: amidohydrolase family protein [Candidatus Sulfotelmatobacter sp.]|jgi:L-fuconolactonase|nr:amidohydrolase family protein [Candidatus Sulfotelmatobacter sp.]
MRIDAHQHFWIYNHAEYQWIDDSMASLRRDFLPQHFKRELESNGFQASVVVQVRQTLQETRWLLDLAAQHPWMAGVVGWVDLRSPDVRTHLNELAQNPKLVGIRHIVQSENDDRFLLQPEFLCGIALLEEFNLAYDILIYPRHLPVAAQLVEQFPRQRFVLDHMAKPPIKSGEIDSWAHGISHLAAFPNVYCKLSGLVTEADWRGWTPQQIIPYLEVAFDCFGPDRLLIGSDWPVCLVAASYAQAVEVVKNYLLQRKPECLDRVLGGNAQRFWRLQENSEP